MRNESIRTAAHTTVYLFTIIGVVYWAGSNPATARKVKSHVDNIAHVAKDALTDSKDLLTDQKEVQLPPRDTINSN